MSKLICYCVISNVSIVYVALVYVFLFVNKVSVHKIKLTLVNFLIVNATFQMMSKLNCLVFISNDSVVNVTLSSHNCLSQYNCEIY